MTETDQASGAKPKVRAKSFRYHTSLERVSPDKSDIRVSAPPEFKGESGVWTPEDLYVAAAEVCLMTTFSALAKRSELEVASYSSEAEGLLEMTDDGHRMTKITIWPRVLVTEEASLEEAESLLHKAHERCLIAESMKTSVAIEPLVEMIDVETPATT